MSRRDIIIISVLLNASLLAVLFFLARHGEEENIGEQPDIMQQIAALPETPPSSLMATSIRQIERIEPQDEIDEVLKNYASPDTSSTLDDNMDDLENDEDADSYPIIPQEMEKDSDQYVEITVKRGDALEKIARANGTTISAIKNLNQLKNEKVFVGQVLRIPIVQNKNREEPKPQLAAKRPDAHADMPVDTEFYVIKSGDNPWKIAKLFHVKFEDLLKLNNLNEEKARNLKVGDKIRVR